MWWCWGSGRPQPRCWGAVPGNPGEDGRLPGASGSLSTAGAGGGDMVPDPAPWSASWLRFGLRFPEAAPRTPAGRGQRSWSSPQGLNWGLSLEAGQGGDEHRSKDSPSLLDPFLGLALSQCICNSALPPAQCGGAVSIPISQLRTQRPREVKELVQGHRAGKGPGRGQAGE